MFHSLGPENARLPTFRFVRITPKSPRVGDRSPLELEAKHGVTVDDMYCIVLYLSIYIAPLNSHGQIETLLVQLAPRKETSFKK